MDTITFEINNDYGVLRDLTGDFSFYDVVKISPKSGTDFSSAIYRNNETYCVRNVITDKYGSFNLLKLDNVDGSWYITGYSRSNNTLYGCPSWSSYSDNYTLKALPYYNNNAPQYYFYSIILTFLALFLIFNLIIKKIMKGKF